MSWKQYFDFEDAPSDMTLKVHEALPEGVAEHSALLDWHREAYGTTADGKFHNFHHCKKCGGWIEGTANAHRVNTLDSSHLAGRSGTEYHCRRCGREIGFVGIMS